MPVINSNPECEVTEHAVFTINESHLFSQELLIEAAGRCDNRRIRCGFPSVGEQMQWGFRNVVVEFKVVLA